MDFISDVTDFIFISSKPRISDVIFLPGGSDPALPEKGAELYKAGYAPLLVASGRYGKELGHFKKPTRRIEIYGDDYETEADFYRGVLTMNGVPSAAIICEKEAEYTYQNAVFSKELLQERGIKVRCAILVCKAFHARRAYTYYQNAFPDVDISVVAVPGKDITREGWYKTDAGRRRVAGELKRMGDQLEYLAINKETTKV